MGLRREAFARIQEGSKEKCLRDRGFSFQSASDTTFLSDSLLRPQSF